MSGQSVVVICHGQKLKKDSGIGEEAEAVGRLAILHRKPAFRGGINFPERDMVPDQTW